MRKHSIFSDKFKDNEFVRGSQNWLLHARYVRGEHGSCLDLADRLQCTAGNTHRFALYVKGLVLAEAGRFQEALEKFHSCIRLHPHDPEPLKQVAKCLFRQGRFQLSLEAYLEAYKLTKHPDAEIYSALAECAWNLGDMSRGVEWAQAAVQAGGGERAGALLARLLLAAEDVPGALAAYDQALTSYACSADTLAAAGALRLRAGDPRRAFQLLGAALAQQPTQHAAALALAAMMLQHKDVDAALARLKAALVAHPTCVAAHADLGIALLAKKKYVAALTCLQRAAWTAPLSSKAAHNLGLALLLCRRPASAFCRLAAAAALDPAQPYTVLLIAIALERLGDARADAAYARAVTLAPNDPLIRLNVAARHGRAGRMEEAVEEVGLVAQLLSAQEKPDMQLASSLATLTGLLQEAGVDVGAPLETEPTPPPLPHRAALGEERLADESTGREFAAHLVVLPPMVLGYNDLYYDDQKPNESEQKVDPSTPETGLRISANTKESAVESSSTMPLLIPEDPRRDRIKALIQELMSLGVKIDYSKEDEGNPVEMAVEDITRRGVDGSRNMGATPLIS